MLQQPEVLNSVGSLLSILQHLIVVDTVMAVVLFTGRQVERKLYAWKLVSHLTTRPLLSGPLLPLLLLLALLLRDGFGEAELPFDVPPAAHRVHVFQVWRQPLPFALGALVLVPS